MSIFKLNNRKHQSKNLKSNVKVGTRYQVDQLRKLNVLLLASAKSLQSCPTWCDTIDGSPPGSPILGFSRQEHWSRLPFPSTVHACMLSRFSLCVTLWTAAHQAPLTTGFSMQEYWSGLPFPSPMHESEK